MSDAFRMGDYLGRIGVSAALSPDLATLRMLHVAHVTAIPFEGIDPFLERPVSLDLDALQAKLVDSRRGGYCFEQSMLFKAVLDRIGFSPAVLIGRVRWTSSPEAPLGPRTHMFLKVDLAEGPYLVDVGFGACLLDAPLRLEPGGEQATAMGRFRLTEADGHYWLAARQPEGYRAMYAFDLAPQRDADCMLGNYYTSTSPLTAFRRALLMERLAGDKRLKLINRRFIIERREGVVESEREVASPDELDRLLREMFGVESPAPVETLFAKICAATV